jgi:glycerophosphoryl diester phosphodiesterase
MSRRRILLVIIFGHRGAPGSTAGRGENTIASFRKAIESGATGLEFDVRRCRDARLVVIHDDTINRTTDGRGYVRDYRYEELARFDAGFGERIPLLSEVLDTFGGKCLLNIELKDPGIAHDVKRLIVERSLEADVIVSTFDWPELSALAPDVAVGLLSSSTRGLIAAARQMAAAAIHPRRDILRSDLIAAARESQLRVYVWTINDPAVMRRAQEAGADGIFTDFPERWYAHTI